MNKKSGISGIGFAIIIVILIALIMIISAPTFVREKEDADTTKIKSDRFDIAVQLQEFENRVNSRIDNLERNQKQSVESQYISNKYICTIEGNVDDNGNVVDVNSGNGLTKFVFVCEYKR